MQLGTDVLVCKIRRKLLRTTMNSFSGKTTLDFCDIASDCVLSVASDMIEWLTRYQCFDSQEAHRSMRKLHEEGYIIPVDFGTTPSASYDPNSLWFFQLSILWPRNSTITSDKDYALHLYRRQEIHESALELEEYEVKRLVRLRDALAGHRKYIQEGMDRHKRCIISSVTMYCKLMYHERMLQPYSEQDALQFHFRLCSYWRTKRPPVCLLININTANLMY